MKVARKCADCGEKEGRDATEYEITFRIAPPTWSKEYRDGRWTGNWLCSKCNNRIRGQKRRAERAPVPSKIEACRVKHNIILRIVKGLPACIERKNSQIIHHGIGCAGCPLGE